MREWPNMSQNALQPGLNRSKSVVCDTTGPFLQASLRAFCSKKDRAFVQFFVQTISQTGQ